MAPTEIPESIIQSAADILRHVEPAACLVWPRIVRRVIIQDRKLASLGWNVPHRKCYFLKRDALLNFVALDEVGVTVASALPEDVILIARPDPDDILSPTLPEVLRYAWRMLLHVRIHQVLEEQLASGVLTPAKVRERIDQIGQTRFDEIYAVLRRENLLLPSEGKAGIYVEFAALFGELQQFSPEWLPSYFPSLHSLDAVADVLSTDINFAQLAEATRLPGAADAHSAPGTVVLPSGTTVSAPLLPPSELRALPGTRTADRILNRLLRRVQATRQNGNAVRAAILLTSMIPLAEGPQQKLLEVHRQAEVESLVTRLRAALEFSDSEADIWRACLFALVEHASTGFWNHDARLLYDLQKVCVDHERQVSVVDLWSWLRTLGRRPLKRALPNQREVLMSKHLRSATERLPKSNLPQELREQLSGLLRAAAKSAELQLRKRLRPLLNEALDRVELKPVNVPEAVSRKKLIEELGDRVVQTGYLTMGMLRDTLSRNHLKLQDLTTPQQIWRGDQLLQCDRELATLLDGVYYRGEFYLRWLQGLSALAFGTYWGQRITQYLAIPFGAALVILEGLDHLAHAVLALLDPPPEIPEHAANHLAHRATNAVEHVVEQATEHAPQALAHAAESTTALVTHATNAVADAHAHAHAAQAKIFMSWPTFLALGFFLLFLIHVRSFRRGILEVLKLTWKLIRTVLWDVPVWLFHQPWMQQLLGSPPAMFVRRYLLAPLGITVACSLFLMVTDLSWTGWWISVSVIFAGLVIALNSRLGRDLEEVSAEWLMRVLHRIGVKFLLALFEFVMETFKRVLEFIERVLYAVDEWLRFKSGESQVTLVFKAILGMLWAAVTFLIRFVVNLLIEPQVNPIKHFPVVTVSHKIILPMQPLLSSLLRTWMDRWTAEAAAATTVFLLPGIFGFLVWELKENWRLFASNRARRLYPTIIGSHGETLIRLMKPGFHSGTLPKLYSKLRRAERKAHLPRWKNAKAVLHEKLHHVAEALQHHFEREFITLLTMSRDWWAFPIRVGHVETASNSLRVELIAAETEYPSLYLAFEEQSGWLVASIQEPGWLWDLNPAQRETFRLALIGIYKTGGVDLIREQIEARISPRSLPYDISPRGLVVWPTPAYDVEIYYTLQDRRLLVARPRRLAKEHLLHDLDAREILFSQNPITWRRWVESWMAEADGTPLPTLFPDEQRLLPDKPAAS